MSVLPKNVTLKDGSTLTIREATPEDAAAIIEMVLNILSTSDFTLTQPEEFIYTVEEEVAILKKHQDNPGGVFMVAEQNGQLLGNMVFDNGKKKRNQHQGEFAMGLISSYRGKGIGTQLIETLIEWAEKNPLIRKVKLQVLIQNSHAIHLYKNFGFMEEGRFVKEVKMEDGEFMDVISMFKFV